MKNRYDDALVCPYCGAVQNRHVLESESENNCRVVCERCGKEFGYDVTVIHSYYVKVVE